MRNKNALLWSFMLLLLIVIANAPNASAESSIESGKPLTGYMSSSNDAHNYSFTTERDGEVRIVLDQMTAGYSMYLYDGDGNDIGGDYYSSPGNSIVINKKIKQGTYTIKIAPYGWNGTSSGSYALRATYAGPTVRDAKTFESNDTVETAYPIDSGVFYKSSSFSSLDLDVYRFTTTEDGEVNIALEQTTAGYSMYLYDQDGERLGGDYYSSAGKSINIIENLVKGTYYIKVSPYSWEGTTEASYRLRSTYTGSFKRDTVTYEPNETPATSYPILTGVYYTSSSESYLDRDMYQFTTTKDGEVRIVLDKRSAGYSMSLYDQNKNYIGGDYYSSSGNSIIISKSVAKGSYYVEVSPYSWDNVSKATYRLKATFASAFTPNATTYEPNDTFETSTPIASEMAYTSTSDTSTDVDTYRFATAKDGEVEVVLDKTSAGYSMYVYDENGNYIGGDYYSSAGNTIAFRTNLKKGTYYAKVAPYSWSGVSSGSYRVKARFPITRKVAINGTVQGFQHQFINGVVLVPLKETSSKLGMKLTPASNKKTLTLTKGQQTVILQSGSDVATVNGKKVKLSAKVRSINGQYWVAATLYSSTFGAKVAFDPATHTIQIDMK